MTARTSMTGHREPTPQELERCARTLSQRREECCVVAPHPDLGEKIKAEVTRLRSLKSVQAVATNVRLPASKSPGLNDGLIYPGSYFPLGTSVEKVRSAAADRAPLHGTLRVIVVLVDFDDQEIDPATEQRFDDLFFSTGVVATGSVKEYFDEVTDGLVDIVGDVVGPYRLPQDLADYANGESGLGSTSPNARTMARDAAEAADPDVNFGPYDNDGDGFVDAFVVVHAGPGAEVTGDSGDIWSHKWVLAGGEYDADSAKIYAYLTIPEDARLGVSAHELGHLLFGLPDLYDTDYTSEGIGNWCLMAGGSWNGGGNTPAHPSAWCKADQAWVSVQNVTSNGTVSIPDVKDGKTVLRLWKDGASGQEYFLVENRQQSRFDAELPSEGLLIWHIDEAISNNTDEAHYKVALEQADGALDLEGNSNRGDAGDPYPGSSGNTAFNNSSTPSSRSYGGVDTCVSVTDIGASADVMTANIRVRCAKPKEWRKEFKDLKDSRKEVKEFKEIKERKEGSKDVKDFKEGRKEFKEQKEIKEWSKEEFKERKEPKEIFEGPSTTPPAPEEHARSEVLAVLEERIRRLEEQLAGGSRPYIGEELRPDLTESALSDEPDIGPPGILEDKRSYDTKPPES